MKKIVVFGAGYVGICTSILLRKNDVTIVDTDKNKIKMLNNGLLDKIISESVDVFKSFIPEVANIKITTNYEIAKDADYIILTVPTNLNEETNEFDMSIIENILREIIGDNGINKNAIIIIRSTIQPFILNEYKKKYNYQEIYHVPEFLRENNALFDELYPSRIVVGGTTSNAKEFGEMMVEGCLSPKKYIKLLYTKSDEAACIKLFSNTFLAMRISFFNELDSFAMKFSLDSKKK